MNILITGGASGLGLYITEKLANDKNMFIFFTYNSSQESAYLLEKRFTNVKSIKLDFYDDLQIDDFIKSLHSLDIDVLINNAITGFVFRKFHSIKKMKCLIRSKEMFLYPLNLQRHASIYLERKKWSYNKYSV